ncbi:MAG TPA: hypothetical protein K8W24_11080 [Brachybacterium paraconglomeratum]|uniref:Uncharacterized protein n=1 Tax=Brachybacterium paraconglomeratum TaxID=173362 RepID=A0A921GQB4_9MICO|nr:hypothetical protein [Brachybacterium paraconglomeratum]
MSDQRGDAVNGSPADPDLEDTVRRTPSERAPADHRPGDAEETVPDGSGGDLPEDDTVLREAPPTEADGDALVHEVPLSDTDDDTVVRRPGGGLFDPSPGGRPFLPDTGPIQRFDQRPRFEYPAASAASPPAARSTGTPPPAAQPQGSPSQGAQPADGSPSTSSPAPPGAPPGIDATGPRRRGLLVPAIAFGCALLLLLGVGGGLTAVWLGDRDAEPTPAAESSSSSGQAEPGVWQPLEEGQEPTGTADDLEQVLAENPLQEATLQAPTGCELPPTDGGALAPEELAGYLEAGADCLESSWGEALGAVGVDFTGPDVVVYTVDALPEDSACDPARFSEATPVVCQADNTLYWPAAWDPGFSNTDAEEVPQLYMWHLSYSYALFAMSAVSLDDYFGTLLISLAEEPERAEESQRRYALQVSCIASATVYRMPEGIRPAGRVEGFVTSVDAQAAPATAGEPSAEARAVWVGQGKDSEGVLRSCDTWSAAPDAVA